MRTEFCSIEIIFNILKYHKWKKQCNFLWLVACKALSFGKTCDQIFMHLFSHAGHGNTSLYSKLLVWVGE